jgi:hypothetical protein
LKVTKAAESKTRKQRWLLCRNNQRMPKTDAAHVRCVLEQPRSCLIMRLKLEVCLYVLSPRPYELNGAVLN